MIRLPAHRGAGFLEVHAHHHFQRARVLLAQRLEAAGVFERSHRVVDGARSDHHQQPVVAAVDDVLGGVPGLGHQRFAGGTADGEKADEVFWGREHGDVLDSFVVGVALSLIHI